VAEQVSDWQLLSTTARLNTFAGEYVVVATNPNVGNRQRSIAPDCLVADRLVAVAHEVSAQSRHGYDRVATLVLSRKCDNVVCIWSASG